MLRSIATVSISGTLPEKLHAIAAAGYQGVEIFENDLLYYTGTPAEIRQLAADLGLKITLFQPFRDFEGASRAQFAANMARARRKFALMRELGCETLLLCSNVQPDCSADSELQVADLRALATLAEEEGIAIGYEALAWGTHVNRWQQAWERVRRVDSPALGLVLDSFHILARGDTLDALQYLVSLQVNKNREGYMRVSLDTENYRAKREEALNRLAQRMAARARKTGRKVTLEPMNPYERRVLHSALQNNPYVTTHSEGEEPYRRVVITLKSNPDED